MRKLLGFPDELYEKIFNPPPGGNQPLSPYASNTKLFLEMEAATQRSLKSLKEWGQIPRWERKLWVYFLLLKNEKESYQMKKAEEDGKAKAEMERKARENAPKVATLPRERLRGA
jgi:hypothetical protein